MPVRLEAHGAVKIPLQKQRPQIGVILSKIAQLSDTLIVTEPTAIPCCRCVNGREKILIAGDQTAEIFFPSDLHQWKDDIWLSDVFFDPQRLISSYTKILNDIYFAPLIPGAVKKDCFL